MYKRQVNCRLEIAGPTDDLVMRIEWLDNWNRLLQEISMRFSQEFKVNAPEGSLSVINFLRVTLRSKSGPEARAVAEVLMPEKVRPTDFYVLSWAGAGESWGERLIADLLRRKVGLDGVSNVGVRAGAAHAAALSHLRVIPYTTFLHAKKLAKELFNEK